MLRTIEEAKECVCAPLFSSKIKLEMQNQIIRSPGVRPITNCDADECMAWKGCLFYECEECGREYTIKFKCNTCACGSKKFLPAKPTHGYCKLIFKDEEVE